MTIYNAIQKQYPTTQTEWDTYHGIIITGSLSAAYDEKKYDWIQCLIDQIQCNIHLYKRKMIGVCFGHQIYAHSFQYCVGGAGDDDDDVDVGENEKNDNPNGGLAVKCKKGIQVGVRTFQSLLWSRPRNNFSNEDTSITMLYTHGDMVQSIPNCALSLGGTNDVPIQACAYFSSMSGKESFEKWLVNHNNTNDDGDSNNNDHNDTKVEYPYAFTFQGHPEYASSTHNDIGFQTYFNILQYMDDEKKVEHDVLMKAKHDALYQLELIEQNCVDLMYHVMSILDWMI
jgi:GMP synthase-like glutamine amidotransferase